MKVKTRIVVMCSLLLGLAMGTESDAAPTKATALPRAPVTTADWQKKWDDTLAAARKEGELFVYLNAPADARIAIPEAFKRKFGLTLNVISGSGVELANRLVTEYRSGIHQVDAYLAGSSTAMVAKAQGVLQPILPLLILPEVASPKVWLDQRLPFDKDGTAFDYLSQAIPPVVYNTDLVKEGQITSYLDLLKPEWKGKMVLYDPAIGGGGSAQMGRLTVEVGVDKANQFLTGLVKEQEVAVTRELGQQMEWVARGKYPLAVFPQTPAVVQYLKAGAPIAAASFKEFTGVAASNGGLAVPKYPPHPNATTIFVNWLLSKEGQAVAVKSMSAPSTRLDVPPEGVDPIFVLKPGKKFIFQTEEFNLNVLKWQEAWKRILKETK